MAGSIAAVAECGSGQLSGQLAHHVGVGHLADIANQFLPGDDIPGPQSCQAIALGEGPHNDDIPVLRPQRHRRFLPGQEIAVSLVHNGVHTQFLAFIQHPADVRQRQRLPGGIVGPVDVYQAGVSADGVHQVRHLHAPALLAAGRDAHISHGHHAGILHHVGEGGQESHHLRALLGQNVAQQIQRRHAAVGQHDVFRLDEGVVRPVGHDGVPGRIGVGVMVKPFRIKSGKGLPYHRRKTVGIHTQRAVQRVRRRVGRVSGIAAHLREQFVSDLHRDRSFRTFIYNLPQTPPCVKPKSGKSRPLQDAFRRS